MDAQTINIDGIMSVIKHYYCWKTNKHKPFIHKEGCLIIEDFPTYLYSEDLVKINEYDLRFDLLERCKILQENLLNLGNNLDEEGDMNKCIISDIKIIEKEIIAIKCEYYDYIKNEVIMYFAGRKTNKLKI